jgi:hypothetical protein
VANPSTLAGAGHTFAYFDAATGRYSIRSNNSTAFSVGRDQNAGDSTNLVQMRVGNHGTNQGEIQMRYTNAAASGQPDGRIVFIPRNNANTSNFLGGEIKFQKVSGADTTSLTLSNTAASLALSPDGLVSVPGSFWTGPARSSFTSWSQGYLDTALHNFTTLNQGATKMNAFQGLYEDNTMAQVHGIQGTVITMQTGNRTLPAIGVEGDGVHFGSGTSALVTGLSSYAQNSGGNVADLVGTLVQSNAVTTTATNNYGILIQDQTGVATNNWAIRSLGTAPAQFGGAVIAGLNVVTFSATPTFDALKGNTQKITLTGNVTSSTLSNATAGQSINFIICQDGTGNRTFVWPSNVKGGMTIGSTASKCSAQTFVFDGTNAYALSTGVANM